MTISPDDKALFIIDEIYPESSAIFSWQPEPLASIQDSCLVVLDTSALLLPYEVTPATMREIEETLGALAKAGRLRIPGHVAREFARHRPTKLMELFQQLNTKKSQARHVEGGKYPLLSALPEYQRVVELESEINKLVAEYQKAVSAVVQHVKQWEWNDPLSKLYAFIFGPESVVELTMDQSDLAADLRHRQEHKIPPGYKDAGKDDNAAGDLIVWQTVLQIGRDSSQSLLLVTADQKSDWWHRSGNEGLYSRYELVDEYRRASGGRSFHLATLSTLLGLRGASAEAVADVREEELDAAGDLTVDMLINDWPRICADTKAVNRRVESLLREADPKAVHGREIELVTAYDFHRTKLDADDVRKVVIPVLERFYGAPIRYRINLPREQDFDDVPF